jgi:OOP family OmpA-OmpF porin
MKKILLPLIVLFVSFSASSQVLKRMTDRVKQKMEQKADEKVDKTIDDATAPKSKTETEEGEVKVKNNGSETKIKTESKNTSLKSYSKFDFVPGDKILYAEDFSQDVIGEFPLKWNTDGSGEVVTLDGIQGKWLKMIESTKYTTPYATKLPDNYTIEFDMLVEFKDNQRTPELEVNVFKPISTTQYAGMTMRLAPNAGINAEGSNDRIGFYSFDEKATNYLQGKDQLIAEFTNSNHKSTPVHVALWIQKERVRGWINQIKVYDLPKAMSPNVVPDHLGFLMGHYNGDNNNYQYYISNLKIAMATPDNRSKLITDGKWSTTGILFDVNSDKIKPISYGVLKEIANTLKENADVRVKIIGHTDSDGDDAANLDLSKRRAASVRIALTTEFGIDGSRFETDGAGETKPLGDNKTPEGKAQNRRVEFVKL